MLTSGNIYTKIVVDNLVTKRI